MPGEAKCRDCKEPIIWARTDAGKNIPLDTVPRLGGNIECDRQRNATVVSSDANKRRYVSHFVTCPGASKFRKSRGKK